MKTIKLRRLRESVAVFDRALDLGRVCPAGEVAELSEGAALDLLRDEPDGWELLAIHVPQPLPTGEES